MGLGADNGCECVGYQAHEPDGQEQPNLTMNRLVAVGALHRARSASSASSCPQDPGAADELAKQGKIAFDFGMFWFKGQHIGSGQAPVKRYNRQLRDLIAAGKAEAVVHRQPRAAARPGAGGLRALRQPGRRLDQGRPAPRSRRWGRDMAGDAERTPGRHPRGRRRRAGGARAAARRRWTTAGARRSCCRSQDGRDRGSQQRPRGRRHLRGRSAVEDATSTSTTRCCCRAGRSTPTSCGWIPPRSRSCGTSSSRASRSPRSATARGPWSRPTVVRGRRLTSWPSVRTDLRNAGAEVVDEQVVTDGNSPRAGHPTTSPAFCARITEEFAKQPQLR